MKIVHLGYRRRKFGWTYTKLLSHLLTIIQYLFKSTVRKFKKSLPNYNNN